MATVQAKTNSAGVANILTAIELHGRCLYGTLAGAEEHLKSTELKKKSIEEELVKANQNVIQAQECLKQTRHKMAELIIDVSKLGCPDTEIKKAWSGYSSHEIAEWIKNE